MLLGYLVSFVMTENRESLQAISLNTQPKTLASFSSVEVKGKQRK